MTMTKGLLGRYWCAGFLMAALAGAVSPSAAAAGGGPFSVFVGDWTGDGEIVGANGTHERIRCKATYTEAEVSHGLSQSIVCASASYRVNVQSYVEASGDGVRGNWREDTRNASGQLTGKVADGHFEGSVVGPGFTAQVSLQSDGRRQSVHILPKGSDISDVTVELQKQG